VRDGLACHFCELRKELTGVPSQSLTDAMNLRTTSPRRRRPTCRRSGLGVAASTSPPWCRPPNQGIFSAGARHSMKSAIRGRHRWVRCGRGERTRHRCEERSRIRVEPLRMLSERFAPRLGDRSRWAAASRRSSGLPNPLSVASDSIPVRMSGAERRRSPRRDRYRAHVC